MSEQTNCPHTETHVDCPETRVADVIEKVKAATEVERLREALKWAVSFIQCNSPHKCGDYPGYRNAVDLVNTASMYGPFYAALAAYDLEVEDKRKALARVAELEGELAKALEGWETRNHSLDSVACVVYGWPDDYLGEYEPSDLAKAVDSIVRGEELAKIRHDNNLIGQEVTMTEEQHAIIYAAFAQWFVLKHGRLPETNRWCVFLNRDDHQQYRTFVNSQVTALAVYK